MHIALFHDAVIPPPKYGGTERIIAWLAKALLALGHEVTLLAQEGSDVPGARFVPIDRGRDWESQIPTADITHLWGTPSKPPRKLYLVTIQGNGKPGETFLPNTVFISRSHALNHGSQLFVYNGIDPEDYACDEKRENFLVFLAKASWKVKNLRGAVEIARALGMPLEVLGSRNLPWPLNLKKPIRWKGVRYHGMVGDAEKKQILRKARGLLFPVRWPEPFGIALTEALASGCPVFGTPYGSLPEIVTSDVGVLSTNPLDLITAIRDSTFSPQACRARVSQGFTHLDMARNYLAFYSKVIQEGSLLGNSVAWPCSQFQQSSETLLPWHSLHSLGLIKRPWQP